MSGKETPQYKAVLQSMEDIKRSIKATPSALETLRTKFQMTNWIDYVDKCSEKELVVCALENIRNDSSKYSTFLAMIRDTPGLDTVANIMEQKKENMQ